MIKESYYYYYLESPHLRSHRLLLNYLRLRPWTWKYDFRLWTWPRSYQDEPARQISRSGQPTNTHTRTLLTDYSTWTTKIVIGNESVPYNWHSAGSLGWPFSMPRYKYIFQIKYTEAILSNTTRKLSWLEISKMLHDCSLKINLLSHLLLFSAFFRSLFKCICKLNVNVKMCFLRHKTNINDIDVATNKMIAHTTGL